MRKITQEIFEQRAKEIHGDRYEYGKYMGSRTKMNIKCSEHEWFEQQGHSHLIGMGCGYCANNIAISTEQFIIRAQKIHNDWYDYSKTIHTGLHNLIIVGCPTHGDFKVLPLNILRGFGCPGCLKESRLQFDDFIKMARKIHGYTYQYVESSFTSSNNKMAIICKIHGKFHQTPCNHYNQMQGCPKCSSNISVSERLYFESLGIPDDKNHRQVRIRVKGVKRAYVVDAFDPNTKTIYEFDGDFWHGNPEKYPRYEINPKTKKTFGSHYADTLRKKKLLMEEGYTVVSIWESEWKKQCKLNMFNERDRTS